MFGDLDKLRQNPKLKRHKYEWLIILAIAVAIALIGGGLFDLIMWFSKQ